MKFRDVFAIAPLAVRRFRLIPGRKAVIESRKDGLDVLLDIKRAPANYQRGPFRNRQSRIQRTVTSSG
ncbi:MAG: hypothetical protein WAK55_17815, partial [Xanthobacteraceae bacterium]